MKTIIIHDLPQDKKYILDDFQGATIVDATRNYARCKGCFHCWLKTPGKCTFDDSMELLGAKIGTYDHIILISRCLYGGLSVEIKRLWDRSIPAVLPFFKKKNNELHHTQRYKHLSNMQVFFYYGQDIPEQEKEVARKLVVANGLNFMAEKTEVHFVDQLELIKELSK